MPVRRITRRRLMRGALSAWALALCAKARAAARPAADRPDRAAPTHEWVLMASTMPAVMAGPWRCAVPPLTEEALAEAGDWLETLRRQGFAGADASREVDLVRFRSEGLLLVALEGARVEAVLAPASMLEDGRATAGRYGRWSAALVQGAVVELARGELRRPLP